MVINKVLSLFSPSQSTCVRERERDRLSVNPKVSWLVAEECLTIPPIRFTMRQEYVSEPKANDIDKRVKTPDDL